MSPSSIEEDWDLTPVIDLIYSLSIGKESQAQVDRYGDHWNLAQARPHIPVVAEETVQLGNFDKIWKHLGQPLDLLPPNVPPIPEGEYIEILNNNGCDYTTPLKAVRWRDEFEGTDLADNDESYDPQNLSDLTKTQRKKVRRKQRQKDRVEALVNGSHTISGSEDDSEKDIRVPHAPDRKAVIDDVLYGNSKPEAVPGHRRSRNASRAGPLNDAGDRPVASPHPARKKVQILKPERESALAIAAAKKARLIAKLTEIFIDERQFLNNISLVQHVDTITENPVEGIHVFVDASNIMIGFHDALKLFRGQSMTQRIRRQPLSFHNLSLILERGRPTAKRIVVGSDNFPAISEAKAIGYETNILDRVHKAKELTTRQKRFSNGGNGTGTGTGSGSETTATVAAVQYAPEKWVEQAVDEILHLKMMESVVDASEPSTMVLATGDAAEAEYSGGFMKMVERALGKRWKVELVCFRHNMSGAYKRKEFRQRWGERFKIVELDDFVETLLGTE